MVADDYTDFINNFEIAMETLNAESSQSHSFRKFLEVSQYLEWNRFFDVIITGLSIGVLRQIGHKEPPLETGATLPAIHSLSTGSN